MFRCEHADKRKHVSEHSSSSSFGSVLFSGVTKRLYIWLCPSVDRLVGQLVGWSVMHLVDNPYVTPIGLLGLVL